MNTDLTARYLEGGVGELRTDLQRPDAGAHTRVHHRSLLAYATPRPRLGGTAVRLPPIREPWPETAEQWYACATVMQLRADHRRETERAIRRNHRREIASMLKAAGVVLGCMLAMGVAYLGIWWLWALVTP